MTIRARLLSALVAAAAAATAVAPAPAGAQDRRRDDRPARRDRGPGRDDHSGAGRYSLEQACSDRAQGSTIAFDGLAFLTGGFGQDTFFPPGKVCDFFGFQSMRDVDAGELGHNSLFLTRIADNVLGILDARQRAQFVALAREQAPRLEEFARGRFEVIRAFRRLLEGDVPPGSPGLDHAAVAKRVGELYAIDGELSWRRAQVTGAIFRSLDANQHEALAALKFGDSRTWPDVAEQIDRRTMSHREHVAVMTYASEMFSWTAGSLDADVYFCPERHGTYFGGFYMKDMPAMRNPGTSISTSLTGDAGEAFLAALDDRQRPLVEGLVDAQRAALAKIVETRRAVCTELRRHLREDAANRDRVVDLVRAYGRLDGEISARYAEAFAAVAKTLTPAQRATLAKLRNLDGDVCRGAFLYVESDGMPDHDMMVGIRAWQQQVPLPQDYTGDNAWRVPLAPRAAADPLSAKTHFFRGAIAIAVNGVPIFNPIKNDGRTDTFLAGELDIFGGHAGRADDYHYHVAPVFLAGGDPSKPVAFALDGYAIYGTTEPDGSPVAKLDEFNGHDDAKLGYHYHASKTYPYLNGGFHGEVVEREGQVAPQPHAHPVREATSPLPGATITAFKREADGKTITLTYEQRGRTGSVRYSTEKDGALRFVFTQPDGTTREQVYRPGAGGAGVAAGPDDAERRRPDDRPAREGRRDGPSRGPRGGPDPGDPNRRPWIFDHLDEMDADHDGVLTRAEMSSEADRTFAGYDRDGDGRVTSAERDAAGGVRTAMGGFVRAHWAEVDADGDGVVTRDEVAATAASMFVRSDRDGDGKVRAEDDDSARRPGGDRPRRPRDDTASRRTPEPAAGPVRPTEADTVRATVYADNWFLLYVNGKPVAVDPIDFLPHNVVTFDFLPEYPMTIAVLAKDNADPRTGLEYGDRIGDAGFVLKFSDGTVTNAKWKARCFHRGPLGRDVASPRVETAALPANWFATDFDDSAWEAATEYSAERVRPPDALAGHDLEGARFLWTSDLELDNTVVFRLRVERPGWKPRWTTRPDLDVSGSPGR
jgi:hypothetical protein